MAATPSKSDGEELRPHKGPSETLTRGEARSPWRCFDPTRVRLKLRSDRLQVLQDRCFDPTRVRLKHVNVTFSEATQYSLRPHKGPSETGGSGAEPSGRDGFDPTRVRLKLNQLESDVSRRTRFDPTRVRLKRRIAMGNVRHCKASTPQGSV